MNLPRFSSLIILQEKEALDSKIAMFLLPNEKIVLSCRNLVDKIIFTDSRLLLLKQNSLLGKRKDIFSLSYQKVHAFCYSTSDHLALQNYILITFVGLETLKLGFFKNQNITNVISILSDKTNFY